MFSDKPAGARQQEHRKSVNSEWYKALQKGGDIPDAGLATKKATMTSKNIFF